MTDLLPKKESLEDKVEEEEKIINSLLQKYITKEALIKYPHIKCRIEKVWYIMLKFEYHKPIYFKETSKGYTKDES